LALLAGCSAYLHNPELETSTAAVKTGFDGLTAPAFFDAQEKNLAELAGREDRALAELLVASRNYRMLNVIEPATAAAPGSAASRLRSQVEADLSASFGTQRLSTTPPRPGARSQMDVVLTAPFLAQTANENLAFMRENVADRAQTYRDAGGTGKVDCKSVRATAAPAGNDPVDVAYRNLKAVCDTLYGAQAFAEECTLGATQGTLQALCIEGVELRDNAAAQQRKKELEAAAKALKAALGPAEPPAEDRCDEPAEGSVAAAAGATPADRMIAAASGLPDDEQLKVILCHLEAVFGKELDSTLDSLVADARAKVDAATGNRLDEALALLGAVQGVADAENKSAADQASALLIGLAKIRHDINILDLDIATRKQTADIVDRQAALLRRQIYFLAQAQQSLDQGAMPGADKPRAEAEAVTFYVRSLDAGRNPYELLTFRRSQLLRSAALKRARLTEADYRNLIQPAIDQIAAYGAGGIEAETIANLLSGLPVAGSILVEDGQ
jgi:hypothetical protein